MSVLALCVWGPVCAVPLGGGVASERAPPLFTVLLSVAFVLPPPVPAVAHHVSALVTPFNLAVTPHVTHHTSHTLLRQCPVLDIMLKGSERGIGMCTDAMLYVLHLGARVVGAIDNVPQYEAFCGFATAHLLMETLYPEFISKQRGCSICFCSTVSTCGPRTRRCTRRSMSSW